MSKLLDEKGILHIAAKLEKDFIKKSDLTKEKLEIILHGEHTYRNDGSKDNGDGTHTTTFTCTNTTGTCNARTYTETVAHSYTESIDEELGIITHTCVCGASYESYIDEPAPTPEPKHDHHYRNDGSKDNGDGTHTTTYTCTSTVGECNERIKTETESHSYEPHVDEELGIITYTCSCGASYESYIDSASFEDNAVASVTSTPTTASPRSGIAGVKSVEEILASAKSVDDILKDIPEVEDILAGTATVDDLIASQQSNDKDKQNDQGEAYTIKPL